MNAWFRGNSLCIVSGRWSDIHGCDCVSGGGGEGSIGGGARVAIPIHNILYVPFFIFYS